MNFKKILIAASLMLVMAPIGGASANETKTITFERLPQTAAEVKVCKSPFETAAYAVAAFIKYTENVAEGEAMLNVLKGPEPLNPFGKQFLRDRLRGKEYVARSYVEGTSPANGYTLPGICKIRIFSNPYSYQEPNYARLLLTSSGADNPRFITLRKKPSTGEWFLWTYEGVLADIRPPKGSSGWD